MRKILSFLKIFRYDLLVMLAAVRHPDTPRRVKGLLALAFIYLISPIDLIPDAIPLAGVVDDAVVVPAAVMGLKNLLPTHVRRYAEGQADAVSRYMPAVLIVASLFIFSWVFMIVYGLYRLIF